MYVWTCVKRRFNELCVAPRPYRDIFDFPFETGDLVLARMSKLVAGFSKNGYDHAGIIYRHPQSGQIFCWHSWIENGFRDMLLHSYTTKNAKLHPLHYLVERCFEKVTIRKLKNTTQPSWDETWERIQGNIQRFDPVAFIRAWDEMCFGYPMPDQPSCGGRSCVDLVALSYVHLGIFQADILSRPLRIEHYTSPLDCFLKFNHGYSFGPELVIK